MQFGDKGRELLLELERSDWLPPYNEDAVRRCVQVRQGVGRQIETISPLIVTDSRHIYRLYRMDEQEAQGHWQEIESTIAAAEAMGGSRDNTVCDAAPGT